MRRELLEAFFILCDRAELIIRQNDGAKMIFKTATLGCKVNQYETQWLRSAFLENGWYEADRNTPPEDVGLVLINTCSVTAESDAKSRKLVAHYSRLFPNAEIVVCGCYASSDPERVASLPHVSQVVVDKRRMAEFLRSRGLEIIPQRVSRLAERCRAYVKIQDGCRVGCAYCIIPTTRPYLWSRPAEEVCAEARALSENGYREIVLTGIHLGHYGLDLYPPTQAELDAARAEGVDPSERRLTLEEYQARQEAVPEESRFGLAELLRAIAELRLPEMRVRLGSLEAVEIGDKILSVVESYPDIVCPHFHLSMQSGDDSVLRAMKRRWLSAPYIEKCKEIYRRIPDATITTDVIVGFPGETEEQFERTCDVVREVGFSRVHVFPFSARPGTVAAGLPEQVDPAVKKDRVARVQKIAREERERFARRFIGRNARVVVESVETPLLAPSVARGTTDRYYEVLFQVPAGRSVAAGDVVETKLVGLDGDVFSGETL